MSCGENSLIKAIDEKKDLVTDQIAAATAQFDAAKSQVEGTIATVTDGVNSVISAVNDTVTGLLSDAQAALDGALQSLPNVESMIGELVALPLAGVEALEAFVSKWESAPGFDQIQDIINKGPEGMLEYLNSIDPCKDLPNVKKDVDTGEIKEEPVEAIPANENPVESEPVEPTVVKKEEEPSIVETVTKVEKDLDSEYFEYRNKIKTEILQPLYQQKLNTQLVIAEHKNSTDYKSLDAKADKEWTSPAALVRSSKVTDGELAAFNYMNSLRSSMGIINRSLTKLDNFINAYEVYATFKRTTSETALNNTRSDLGKLGYESYFDEVKSYIDQNTNIIKEYSNYSVYKRPWEK